MPVSPVLDSASSKIERLVLAVRKSTRRQPLARSTGDTGASTHDKFDILIVDDDEDLLDSMRDLIELHGYDVCTATNADDALASAARHQPDLALVDVKLGRESGLDLVPKLKGALPRLSCLVITAFRDADYALRAFASGADDFLLKPLAPERLVRALSERLGERD